MLEMRMGTIESRFADLVWANEPLATKDMVDLCAKEFQWKRTTTYTVLKRLCERGLFELAEGTVTAVISREEFYERQSREYVESAFDGSLPAFVAAFSRGRNTLSGSGRSCSWAGGTTFSGLNHTVSGRMVGRQPRNSTE